MSFAAEGNQVFDQAPQSPLKLRKWSPLLRKRKCLCDLFGMKTHQMVDGLPKEKEHFNTLGVAYPVLMTRILVWISVFKDGI